MEYIVLIIGFVLLIKGADYFVDGSSSVAKIFRIPSIIIGLTVVAFGTSLPEASVSITAAMKGENALALSNVIGSNIFNLLIVVGISAMIRPMAVKASVLKKDFPLSIIVTMVLLLMCIPLKFVGVSQFVISRMEGAILLIIFIIYMISMVLDAKKARQEIKTDKEYQVLSPIKTTIFIIGGMIAIKFGGDFVVTGASTIAENFGLSDQLIGLTIVALGTSLPELVTSIVAAKKGESDLALGNVVGSNLFNVLFVLGASATLHPIAVGMESILDTAILIVCSIIVYLFGFQKKTISKKEGFMMAPLYAAFFMYIIIR